MSKIMTDTEIERRRCLDILEAHQVPVGNSAAGEMACEWTMDALREIHARILDPNYKEKE